MRHLWMMAMLGSLLLGPASLAGGDKVGGGTNLTELCAMVGIPASTPILIRGVAIDSENGWLLESFSTPDLEEDSILNLVNSQTGERISLSLRRLCKMEGA